MIRYIVRWVTRVHQRVRHNPAKRLGFYFIDRMYGRRSKSLGVAVCHAQMLDLIYKDAASMSHAKPTLSSIHDDPETRVYVAVPLPSPHNPHSSSSSAVTGCYEDEFEKMAKAETD